MSIETFSSRPEGPATPRPFAAPPVQPSAPDLPDPLGPATATPTEALQARRLRMARDLERRISGLEQDLQAQATTLRQTSASLRQTLRELQQRSSSLTTELLRTGARLARLGRDHDTEQRQLESRLEEGLRLIDAAMAPLDSRLRQQDHQLHEMKERHDTLSRLYHHLDRIVHRQGRQHDLFTAEFGQRLKLLGITLETQQDFAGHQQTALLALTLQYEQATLDIQRLHSCLDAFTARMEHRLQHLRHRQLLLASLLAALALLSLGLIAWCQTHPLTLPRQAQHQMATLASGLQQQGQQRLTQEGILLRHEARLADLQAALAQERDHSRRLRQEARRHERQMNEMRAQFTTLKRAADSASSLRTATTSH